jgi:hypothetical protein
MPISSLPRRRISRRSNGMPPRSAAIAAAVLIIGYGFGFEPLT